MTSISENREDLFLPPELVELPRLDSQSIPRSEEIAPGRILSGIEVLNLHDCSQIPETIWLPLFGGELMSLWESALPNEGDSIHIRGSSVLTMALGGYVYKTENGLADASLRSDLDVITESDSTLHRLSKQFSGRLDGPVSTKVSIGGIEVGISSLETAANYDIRACRDLENALGKQGYSDPPNLSKHILAKTRNLRATLEKMVTENALSMTSIQIQECVYKHEAVSLELTRSEGKIVGIFHDPLNFFDDLVREGLTRQVEYGEYFGILYTDINSLSLQSCYMDAIASGYLDSNPEAFTTKVPLYALRALPRLMRTSCELNIDLMGDAETLSDFPRMYCLAEKITSAYLRGSPLFTAEGINAVEWFKQRLQLLYARSCVSNLENAFNYTLAHFPFGYFISKDLGHLFDSYHRDHPMDNQIMTELRGLPPEAIRSDMGELSIALKGMIKYWSLVGREYGLQKLALHGHSPTPTLAYSERAQHPHSMSEVIGAVFACMGWKDTDTEKINDVVSNWYPKGILHTAWRTQEFDFDMGLNATAIVRHMQHFETVIEKLSEKK